jgi:hypothetical protein
MRSLHHQYNIKHPMPPRRTSNSTKSHRWNDSYRMPILEDCEVFRMLLWLARGGVGMRPPSWPLKTLFPLRQSSGRVAKSANVELVMVKVENTFTTCT